MTLSHLQQTKKNNKINKRTMKKIFSIVMTLAMAAFTFTSCEDVPAPYDLPGEGPEDTATEITPSGNGTADDPFNVAAVVNYINDLDKDVESTEEVYVKGMVKAVTTTAETISQYGNHTFTVIDEGNGDVVFTAFQVYGPGKKKFTSVDDIQVGDEVVICGKVVNFKGNTPETVGKGASYVVSIKRNGEIISGGDVTPGDVIEKTCAEAAEIAMALEDNGVTKEVYSITGYITSVVGAVSRNQQTFWMADTKDGGQVFEAFYANLPEGVTEFVAGSKVKITGNIMRYKTTAEIKNATVEILEAATPGVDPTPDPTPTPDPVVPTGDNLLSNGDFESWADGVPAFWKSTTTASNATISQSTDAHGGSYSVLVKGDEGYNKRLGSAEITLEAGTYVFSFYVKAMDALAQVRPGYVPVDATGKVGSYVYGDYATLSQSWGLVSYTFELKEKTTLNLVVMNPKKSQYSAGKDVLIDDATLIKK